MKVFADKISIGKIPVVPFPVSTVGVTGSVLDGGDEATGVAGETGETVVVGATVSILGSADPGLTVVSGAGGQYFISSIGTNGTYLMKVAKEGYWPTYHFLSTAPFQDAVVPDVTKSPTLFPEGYINQIAAGKVAVDPNLGIITGRIKSGDGTPQQCAKLTVTGPDGANIGNIVYLGEDRATCDDSTDANQTSGSGLFYIFNLPEGEVFVKYQTDPQGQTPTSNSIISGGVITASFPGVVLVQDIFNSGSNKNSKLSGQIKNEQKEPVAGDKVTLLGVQGFEASVSGSAYTIASGHPSGHPVGGTTYLLKASREGFPDTYQSVTQGDKETLHDLLLASPQLIPASGTGTVYGTIINQLTGKRAENVTLKVTHLDGTPAAGGEVFSPDGRIIIPNLPSGKIVNLAVASGDDSGNTFARVYESGVTVINVVMAKVPPARISYSGSVQNLSPTANEVSGAQVRVLGRSDAVLSGGEAKFNMNLESFGRFVIKTEKEGHHDTYNFFPITGMRDIKEGPPLFSIPRSQTAAMNANVPPDPTRGIIAGAALRYNLVPKNCGGCGTEQGPHTSVVGFFNNDTVADMAYTNPVAGSVTILYGDGEGSFDDNENPPLRLTSAEGVGAAPVAIGTGDFNIDGRADLVVLNAAGDGISVFLGDDGGKFTKVDSPIVDKNQNPVVVSPLTSPTAMVVGLFDSDSILDLAIVDGKEAIIFVGKGNGTFSEKLGDNEGQQRQPLGNQPQAVVSGDFNGDSRLDLAVSNAESNAPAGTISVLLGSTTGTFSSLTDANNGAPIVVRTLANPRSLVLADVNGDGRLDLAVAHPSSGQGPGKVSILLGNTGGGFDPLKNAGGDLIFRSVGSETGADLSGITVGDFNEDNRVDLAVANRTDNSIIVLYGNGDGRFTSSAEYPLGASFSPDTVTLSDSNLDGLFDITVIGSRVVSLVGQEQAIEGVSVEARDIEGARVGNVKYLNASGQVDPQLTATGSGGGFIIFDVPPGIVGVRSTNGGPGNRLIDVYPDSVSYTKIKTIASQPFFISINGVTYDPVGPPPAGVPIGSVNIHLLGIDLRTKSDQTTGNYLLPSVDANSEFIVKLFWDPPVRP